MASENSQHNLEELEEIVEKLKRENQRLEELALQADAANKAKSDFLAMISHEIRTPMNGVIGLTELLIDTELDDKQKNYTSLILTSARNLLTLINSLLDFSKIEAQMMELDISEFNLRKLVAELMTLYSVATERKNIKVFAEIDHHVSDYYMGDSYRIRQILVNLLGNAIKFTEEGSVILKVQFVAPEGDAKDMLRFEVHDSGHGIPADKLDRLFKPFTQVDATSTRRFGGTGLGLSICQKLVELMGGEIGVQSEKDQGSVFWFTTPLEPVKKAARDSGDAPAGDYEQPLPLEQTGKRFDYSALQGGLPVFLVVDDDETNRFVLETILLKTGSEVLNAKNGQEAVEMYRDNEPDMILMDCQMPVLDGFEASKLIHAVAKESGWKRPCIIALTADATQTTRQLCKEVGMDDYLTKPLEFTKLQSVLDNWLPSAGLKILSRRSKVETGENIGVADTADFQGEQIDLSVLERLQANMGNVTPVIDVFLDSLPLRLKDLQEAISASKFEEIRRIAHTIKGSSSQFGANYLSSLCHRAERMGKNHELTDIDKVYEKIYQAAEQVEAFLREQRDN